MGDATESEVPMSTRYTRSVLAATVVSCAFVGWGSRTATASDDEMAVTAVGCLQGEREYRRQQHDSKFAGTGKGLGNEYMLINAVIAGPSFQVQPITEQEAATNCLTSGGAGDTIELKGSAEPDLAGMVGRRVVIHGMLLHTKHDVPVGTSGTYTPGPTGGGWFNPLGHDLKLREISVESFSLVPVLEPPKEETVIIGAQETIVEPPAPPAAAPPQAPAPAPQPAAPAPALPKTASQVPTIGLIGLLSLTCGVGLYLFNRRRARFA
jgi:LPXTG-motif cell wall-anchored protein